MTNNDMPWTALDSVQLALTKLDRALKLAEFRMCDRDALVDVKYELDRAASLLATCKTPTAQTVDPQLAVHPVCGIVLA